MPTSWGEVEFERRMVARDLPTVPEEVHDIPAPPPPRIALPEYIAGLHMEVRGSLLHSWVLARPAGKILGIIWTMTTKNGAINLQARCANKRHRDCKCWVTPKNMVLESVPYDLAHWLSLADRLDGESHETMSKDIRRKYGHIPKS